MNNFFKGILVGVGVGLLVAPMRGEEMRNLVSSRFNELRGYLPENEQLNQYTQQISSTVNQGASNLKTYAQQAADTVKSSASNLNNIAQNAASTAKQTGQNVADTTKQAASSVKSSVTSNKSGSTSTVLPDTAPFPSAYPAYVNPETNTNL